MSSPRNLHSVEGASGTTTGREVRANGHYHVTLFVAADQLDTANDTLTVTIEGSPNGTNWTNLGEINSAKKIDETDVTQDPDNAGVYTGSLHITGAYHEMYRARVSDYTDSSGGDLVVDAWVMASGSDDQGRRGQPDGP